MARVPALMRPRSCAVTSARHSRRPWRIMRNSSVPTPTTAPTVALRAEITPLSGAVTCVYFRRSCCCVSVAWADWTRAAPVCSPVTYWVTCWALRAPELSSARARSAFALDSSALAFASSSAARAPSISARTVSSANTASTWPFLTTSPTLTRTSFRRSPFDSLPMTASCQAAMLPLAVRLIGRLAVAGRVVVTLRAGRGAAFSSLASARLIVASAMTAHSDAAPRAMARARGCRMVFMVSG